MLRLAKLVVGDRSARGVVEELIARRLMRRTTTGAWLPKSRVVAPIGRGSAQILRSASMINSLLRTVVYNSERRYRGDVLLEVMAQVPRLPARNVSAFKRFAKAQGLTFAKSVDDWLEARNLRSPRKLTNDVREAGVVAFAFVQPAVHPHNSR